MKILQELEKAVSVAEFETKNGKWRISEPFYYEAKDGALVFGYVRPEMDKKRFGAAVAEGRIWRLKRVVEVIVKEA